MIAIGRMWKKRMFDKITDSMQQPSLALKLRAKRQEVLTSNISQADTPNYKAVDFSFAKAMQAVTRQNESTSEQGLKKTHFNHIGQEKQMQSTSAMLMFRRGNPASIDGNTVDLEKERAMFAENTVKYEAALRVLNGRISTLKQAMGSGSQ